MTTPTPSPSEAMRLAEEAKQLGDTMARSCASIARARGGLGGLDLTEACDVHRLAQVEFRAAIDSLRDLAALASTQAAEARKTARQHFLHEFGSELNDAKKWAAWTEAQRLIEEEMPEGYRVILDCSPGDWSLEFCDPEGERIRIDDYESTEDFIRTAVEHAKEHVRAALLGDGGTL